MNPSVTTRLPLYQLLQLRNSVPRITRATEQSRGSTLASNCPAWEMANRTPTHTVTAHTNPNKPHSGPSPKQKLGKDLNGVGATMLRIPIKCGHGCLAWRRQVTQTLKTICVTLAAGDVSNAQELPSSSGPH